MSVEKYVQAFVSEGIFKRPLVLFKEQDMKKACKFLERYSTSLSISNVVKETNTQISSRHFPYTCEEVPEEHKKNQYSNCDCYYINNNGSDNYLGHDYRWNQVPLWRSYKNFQLSDCVYMQENGRCKERCCSLVLVFERYLVHIQTKQNIDIPLVQKQWCDRIDKLTERITKENQLIDTHCQDLRKQIKKGDEDKYCYDFIRGDLIRYNKEMQLNTIRLAKLNKTKQELMKDHDFLPSLGFQHDTQVLEETKLTISEIKITKLLMTVGLDSLCSIWS